MHNLKDTVHAARAHLSPSLCGELAEVFTHHAATLATTLQRVGEEGPPAVRPPPHLATEITPPMAEIWRPFARWWSDHREDPEVLAAALTEVGVRGVLVLLGQRQTPASLTDSRATPPTRTALLHAAAAIHDAGLTVAARAWSKHAGRSSDPYWGVVRGTVADKNARAQDVIVGILDATTWWNVFSHGVFAALFEARVSTGHGARWRLDDHTFIGFLDPFDAAQGD